MKCEIAHVRFLLEVGLREVLVVGFQEFNHQEEDEEQDYVENEGA